MTPTDPIIFGRKTSAEKLAMARELRRSMTPAEKKLWDCLRNGQLGGFHFRRQQVIEPFIVDFHCHQARLVIEIDGEIHQHQQAYDQEREEALTSLGLRVIRFSNTEVNDNLDGVLKAIGQSCSRKIDEEIHSGIDQQRA